MVHKQTWTIMHTHESLWTVMKYYDPIWTNMNQHGFWQSFLNKLHPSKLLLPPDARFSRKFWKEDKSTMFSVEVNGFRGHIMQLQSMNFSPPWNILFSRIMHICLSHWGTGTCLKEYPLVNCTLWRWVISSILSEQCFSHIKQCYVELIWWTLMMENPL